MEPEQVRRRLSVVAGALGELVDLLDPCGIWMAFGERLDGWRVTPTSVVSVAEMSSRVELCPLTLADQDEFCSLVRASAELHQPWMWLPTTAGEFKAWMRRFDDGVNRGLLVRIRETGVAAGMVNINSIIRGRYQGASLGYAAFAPSAGRGYMTEGLGLALRHAFDELRLHRLEANIQPANKASLALVQRLGFEYEGLSCGYLYIDGAWRDHERWAITAPAPWTPDPSLPEI